MSTEQEDAAMLLELQEKITRRIREQIFMMIWGMEESPGNVSAGSLTSARLRGSLRDMLVNDPGFVTELTKKIGTRMTNVY